jgi:TPR repeat protein
MKPATFGLSTCRFTFNPHLAMFPLSFDTDAVCAMYCREALLSYRRSRENGDLSDQPNHDFPADGTLSWHEHTDGKFDVKYTEGPCDREWMEQSDRNYLARLDAEKAATRKQEREAQLRESQEKLMREQQLKEEAEEQPKALEAVRSEAEATRLEALRVQQCQTFGTKLSLRELSLKAFQGNAFSQFQLGQQYAVGLDVKLDKKEALQWFKKAAAQGHVSAQVALGRAYEKGEGTEKSLSAAQKWYAKAAAQQTPHAEKSLARVKQRIAKRRKLSSQHPTTASTQNSTSHRSGGSAQENVGLPNRVGLSGAQSVNTDLNYPLHTHQASSSSAGTGDDSLDLASLRPPSPNPTAIAEVLYPFQGANAEELTFSAGAKVRVVDRVTPDLWRCEHDGQVGLVPSQYLCTQSFEHLPSAPPASYLGDTALTSGEALGTAGIFSAGTPSSAENNNAAESESYQMSSSQ